MNRKRTGLLIGGRAIALMIGLFCMLAFNTKASAKPTITAQPVSEVYVNEGEKVTLSVMAIGDTKKEKITYQWQIYTAGNWYSVNQKTFSGSTKNTVSFTANTTLNGAELRCLLTGSDKVPVASTVTKIHIYNKPKVLTQPGGKKVHAGEEVTFTVSAMAYTTDKNLEYQWQQSKSATTGWMNMSDGNSSTYSYIPTAKDNGYYFRCAVTDSRNQTTYSDVAKLTVYKLINITKHPVDASIKEDANAQFSVKATGEGTLTYRWQSSGDNGENWDDVLYYTGANKATMTVPGNKLTKGVMYRCKIMDGYGGVDYSNPATLSVSMKPIIYGNMSYTITKKEGESFSIEIDARGDEHLRYYWKKNGVDMGMPLSTSTLTQIAYPSMDNATYTCTVKDSFNRIATTLPITLRVQKILSVLTNTTEVCVEQGKTRNISVDADGDGLSYRWYGPLSDGTYGYVDLPGYNTDTLTVPGDDNLNGKRFKCYVTDKYGETKESGETIIKISLPPYITKHPEPLVEVYEGDTVEMKVEANGDGLTYQWQSSTGGKWRNVPSDGTDATYKFTAKITDNGKIYQCCIKDEFKRPVYTSAISLIVKKDIKITTQPVSTSAKENAKAYMTVAATGDGLKYQWETSTSGEEGTWLKSAFTGNTSTKLTIPGTEEYNGRYFRCVISDKYGNIKASNKAKMTVYLKPRITRQPLDITDVLDGEEATISVRAEGDDLTYRWQCSKGKDFSDIKIEGHDTDTLSFVAYRENNIYKYRCIITDKHGQSVTSGISMLQVAKNDLEITSQAHDIVGKIGTEVKPFVFAKGAGLKYQWQERAYSDDWRDYEGRFSTSNAIPVMVDGREDTRNVEYRCVVTDRYKNTVYSDVIKIVPIEGSYISNYTVDVVHVKKDDEATLFVEAKGIESFTYKWMQYDEEKDTETAPDAYSYNNTLKLKGLVPGVYTYRCYVTDGINDKLVSEDMYVVFHDEIKITSQPKDKHVYTGSEAGLSIEASGTDLSYQWQKKKDGQWVNVGIFTENTYNKQLKAEDAGEYRCRVFDLSGQEVFSESATVTVDTDFLEITKQPKRVSVNEGEDATFSVTAVTPRTGDISYQWQELSLGYWSDLTGEKSNTLSIKTKLKMDANQYRCIVSDGFDTITSDSAELRVSEKPDITQSDVTADVEWSLFGTLVSANVIFEGIDTDKYFITESNGVGDPEVVEPDVYEGTGSLYKEIGQEDLDKTWEYALYEGSPEDKENAKHVAFKGISGSGNFTFNIADMINEEAKEDTPKGKRDKAYQLYLENVKAYNAGQTPSIKADLSIEDTELKASDFEEMAYIDPWISSKFVGWKLVYNNGIKVRLYFNSDLNPEEEFSTYYCSDEYWKYGSDGQNYYFEYSPGDIKGGGSGINILEIAEPIGILLGYEEGDGEVMPRQPITVCPILYIFELNEKYKTNPESVDERELDLMNAIFEYYYYSAEYDKSLWIQ